MAVDAGSARHDDEQILGHEAIGGRLGLFASAIAGRALAVADAGAGERTWTDGTTVFVDPRARPEDRLRMVAVQAALVGAGSLEPAVVAPLVRRPGLARRYLAVEGRRALAVSGTLLPVALRLGPGEGAALAGSAEASLTIARSRQPIEGPPDTFGVIVPRRVLVAAERNDAAAPPARDAPALVREADGIDDEADADDAGSVGHLLSSPVGGRGALGRLLGRLLRSTRAPGGGGGSAGADTPIHPGRVLAPGGGDGGVATRMPEAPDVPAAFAPRARTYPEWDAYRRRYRPDWCTVRERSAEPGGGTVAPALLDGAALRRPLARIGTGLGRARRRPQGDDIDIDAAVEAQVDRGAGLPAGDAVYIEVLRNRRDLAVLVLLDVSGSAREPGPAGRTVHEHQRAAAGALTAALHDLGDRVALYAFNSQGRSAVHLTRVKAFDDSLDRRVARRLGALVPAAYTRLGAAVRHAGVLLEEGGGTSHRLLLVLSDGFAYDHGYAGAYGEADARRALAELRRRGMGCLCLSVGAGTDPAALRRVFGTAAHASVPTADRLPAVVGPLLRAALEKRTS